jgi:hypothetical protein
MAYHACSISPLIKRFFFFLLIWYCIVSGKAQTAWNLLKQSTPPLSAWGALKMLRVIDLQFGVTGLSCFRLFVLSGRFSFTSQVTIGHRCSTTVFSWYICTGLLKTLLIGDITGRFAWLYSRVHRRVWCWCCWRAMSELKNHCKCNECWHRFFHN